MDNRCLIDTGAQVSTITEDCFQKYFATDGELVDVALNIQITAPNGLGIPYRDNLRQMSLFGQTFRNMDFLVVKTTWYPQS